MLTSLFGDYAVACSQSQVYHCPHTRTLCSLTLSFPRSPRWPDCSSFLLSSTRHFFWPRWFHTLSLSPVPCTDWSFYTAKGGWLCVCTHITLPPLSPAPDTRLLKACKAEPCCRLGPGKQVRGRESTGHEAQEEQWVKSQEGPRTAVTPA